MARVREGRFAPMRTKLLWTALFFVCFMIGRHIPLPFLHGDAEDLGGASAGVLGAANIATGGDYFSPSLFSLGLGPWMGAAILWRFLFIGRLARGWRIPVATVDRARYAVMLILAVIQAISLMSAVFDQPTSGYLACAIHARGTGQVKVGPIHYRHSRLGAGSFLPGGKRIVDSRREELFYYFHPGDLTPPLNVYFSGYRPAEGFEGYFMMAGLGHPFLLITDPRLEGGRFYLGSDELEGHLRQVIAELIDSLGFGEEDVIFSGLSMGSFGALYYGSQFRPHAIIAGKPIIDLGYVAERGRLVRPKDFLTILDMVNFWERPDAEGRSTTADDFTRTLVERWNGDPGFGETKILMSYMQQDDYDDRAYYTLLNSQTGKPTTVIARGYQGRHNDDSPSIVTWFINQYRRVIAEYTRSRA